MSTENEIGLLTRRQFNILLLVFLDTLALPPGLISCSSTTPETNNSISQSLFNCLEPHNFTREELEFIQHRELAFTALQHYMVSQESQIQAEYEIYYEPFYGLVVNTALVDGKIRCYSLETEGRFNVFNQEGYTYKFNPNSRLLEAFDPFNPDQTVGYLDYNGEFVNK